MEIHCYFTLWTGSGTQHTLILITAFTLVHGVLPNLVLASTRKTLLSSHAIYPLPYYHLALGIILVNNFNL